MNCWFNNCVNAWRLHGSVDLWYVSKVYETLYLGSNECSGTRHIRIWITQVKDSSVIPRLSFSIRLGVKELRFAGIGRGVKPEGTKCFEVHNAVVIMVDVRCC